MNQNDLWRIASRVAGWGLKHPKGWTYFHASPRDLGRTYRFVPRIPDWTEASWDGEDCTTPRVCVTEDLAKVKKAINVDEDAAFDVMWVYATNEVPDIIPNSDSVPDDMPDNPYSKWDWDWKAYAEWKGIDPEDREAYGEVVKNCVPDRDETNEKWFTRPITMTRIGKMWENDQGELQSKLWNNPDSD